MRFLNIKTDYAFKKVFGSENSQNILKSFLNATLELPSLIYDLTIVDPYNVPKLQGMKETAVDVKATLEDKTKVIIEMQILNHDGFESRVLYNTAKNYANQLDKGNKYTLLNPVIALTIVNFKMFDFDKYKSTFKLLEKENFSAYKDDIQLQFIELPKFNKSIEACESIEDKWIYFIKTAQNLEIAPVFQDPNLQEAIEIANTASMSEEELELQNKREEFIFIQKNSIEKAKREGREEGREEGMEKGIEKGKYEEKVQLARASLKQNIAIETIALITGLGINEIETLKQ
jgi:predicted transposase/invertase (TIGR01784 family)